MKFAAIAIFAAVCINFAAARPQCESCKNCTLPYEEYQLCGSACPVTCNDMHPVPCAAECVSGCFCAEGYVRNTADWSCVLPEQCPCSTTTTPEPTTEEPCTTTTTTEEPCTTTTTTEEPCTTTTTTEEPCTTTTTTEEPCTTTTTTEEPCTTTTTTEEPCTTTTTTEEPCTTTTTTEEPCTTTTEEPSTPC